MLCLLVLFGYDIYLSKIESLSIFLPTKLYFDDCMRTPGGLVVWLSTLATTSFHYPMLGSLLYVALLAVLSLLILYVLKVPKVCVGVSLLPGAMAMVGLLNLGYIIFSLKSPGYAFSPLIGSILALLLLSLYRGTWWMRLIDAALLVAAYPLLGFYALLLGTMMIATDLSEIISNKQSRTLLNILPMLLAALIIAFFPQIWMQCVPCDLAAGTAYTAPLPRFYAGEESMWTTYYIMFGALLALSFMRNLWGADSRYLLMKIIVSAIALVCSAVAVIIMPEKDANFNLTLLMDRAIRDCDWQKAISIYDNFDDEPTRLNAVLCDVAMIRSGEAPERIFKKKTGSADYNTVRGLRVMHEAGAPLITYSLGMSRYAYRMAMEDRVEYGMSVEQLKLMIKTTLLHGDYKVAQKYLDIIEMVPFQGEWAEKYRGYLEHPEKMMSDREMVGIFPLLVTDDSFINDGGAFERYMWPYLSKRQINEPQQLDLAMIASLVNQDLDNFKQLCDKYLEDHTSLPQHYQEGILAWALTHHTDQYKTTP